MKLKKKKTTFRFWFVDSKKNHKHIFHYQKFWVFLIWKSIYFINCDFVCSKKFFSVFSALSIHLTFPSYRSQLIGQQNVTCSCQPADVHETAVGGPSCFSRAAWRDVFRRSLLTSRRLAGWHIETWTCLIVVIASEKREI